MNRKKCKFSINRITYVGHIFSSNGLKPNPERVEVNVEMTEPNNKEELATFMGMITYLGKFVQNLSAVNAPLHELTQEGVAWLWEASHQEAFSELKQSIANAPALKFYGVEQLVIVSTDASKHGYGAAVLQESGAISYASRCLTPAESNYAPIESELSAVLYGCTRLHDVIYSQKVTVETDHKPLVEIMAKPLHKLIPRIQSTCGKFLWYDTNATWKPGKEMFVPDCLSQAPAKQAASMQELDVIVEVDITLLVSSLSHQRSFRSFGTTQPTMLTFSYIKTLPCRDGLWKEAKYLKPFDHILNFEMLSHIHKVIKVSLKASNMHKVYFSGQA